MKRAGVFSVCLALLALGACASAGTASAAGTARCSGFKAHGVQVKHVRSNFGCMRARSVLRHLLKHGISGLPRKSRHAAKWRCRRSRKYRVCTRPRPRGRAPRRIKFRATPIVKTIAIGGPGSQQPPSAPPAGADAVAQCIGIWNADGLNRALYAVHFYSDHNIREAWVFTIPNAVDASILRCAVIFAVPATDPYPGEFGTDGEVRDPSGTKWQLMNDVPELGDPVAKQQEAPGHVNARLSADGTLQRTT